MNLACLDLPGDHASVAQHRDHVLQDTEVSEWVAVQDHQVRGPSGFEHPDLIRAQHGSSLRGGRT